MAKAVKNSETHDCEREMYYFVKRHVVKADKIYTNNNNNRIVKHSLAQRFNTILVIIIKIITVQNF